MLVHFDLLIVGLSLGGKFGSFVCVRELDLCQAFRMMIKRFEPFLNEFKMLDFRCFLR